jgi:hypothetical protein
LRFTRTLVGWKSLTFEGLLSGAYVFALVDSGATHSFASAAYLQSHSVLYDSLSMPDATLADGTSVRILGVIKFLDFKISCFRSNQQFLVVDMDSYNCVLGNSFLRQANPGFDWAARTMHEMYKGTRITLRAVADTVLPVLHSERFELCSFDAISKRSLSEHNKQRLC